MTLEHKNFSRLIYREAGLWIWLKAQPGLWFIAFMCWMGRLGPRLEAKIKEELKKKNEAHFPK